VCCCGLCFYYCWKKDFIRQLGFCKEIIDVNLKDIQEWKEGESWVELMTPNKSVNI
jgi:hypothetical protein